jgi:hypothetical protein
MIKSTKARKTKKFKTGRMHLDPVDGYNTLTGK